MQGLRGIARTGAGPAWRKGTKRNGVGGEESTELRYGVQRPVNERDVRGRDGTGRDGWWEGHDGAIESHILSSLLLANLVPPQPPRRRETRGEM